MSSNLQLTQVSEINLRSCLADSVPPQRPGPSPDDNNLRLLSSDSPHLLIPKHLSVSVMNPNSFLFEKFRQRKDDCLGTRYSGKGLKMVESHYKIILIPLIHSLSPMSFSFFFYLPTLMTIK